jgi:hypothetical protein
MRMKSMIRGVLALCVVSVGACGGAVENGFVDAGPGGQFNSLQRGGGSDASTGWITVGGSTEIAPNAALSGQVVASSGVPFAAFSDELHGGKLTVMKLVSGKWTTVGSAGFTPDQAYYFTLFVDGSTPYVVYASYVSGGLTVMKYSGSAWTLVGSAGFASASSYGMASLAVVNGTVYVAFLDTSSSYSGSILHVMSFGGTTWSDLGGQPVSTSAQYCAMTVFNGSVYVAYNDETAYPNVLNLDMWTGTAWVHVAQSPNTIDEDWGQILTVSKGSLYLIYYNYTYGVIVLKLSGSTLTSLGVLGSVTNGDYVEYVSGTVYNGVPYVAYDDESRDSDPQPQAATVKFFDGTSWQLYAGYPNPCDIENTYISADQTSGQIYLTYSDCDGYMTVQVH